MILRTSARFSKSIQEKAPKSSVRAALDIPVLFRVIIDEEPETLRSIFCPLPAGSTIPTAFASFTASEDGVVFGEKELLLTNDSYPAACTCHVHDPKVWKDKEGYFMVLGARFGQAAEKKAFGGVLLYHSKGSRRWDYINTLNSPDAFGYMWECPDVFVVGSVSLLSVSPQGLTRERFRFQNIYQSGYFTITRCFLEIVVKGTRSAPGRD